MENTKYVNLPVIGMVQHGIVDEKAKRVKELGYFIGKTKDELMQAHLNKFNELYKGKKSVDIYIFNEEPFTVKYTRYNKTGEVCSCNIESNTATEKNKDGWKKIECNSNCQYRQKNESGKSACNRVGWLKFLVPSVCRDRIFLMKVTGQTSIDILRNYFEFIKLQGISAKGYYTLCLKQKVQTNSLGNTFNNYVLDILKKEDFIQINQIPEKIENKVELSNQNEKVIDKVVTENVQYKENETVTQVKNTAEKEIKKVTNKTRNSKENSKNNKELENVQKQKQQQEPKKENKNITPNIENKKINNAKKAQENTEANFDNIYGLIKTFYKKLKIKDKEEKEYLVGEFADTNDRMCQICIRPEDSEELSNCELGTIVKIDIKEIGGIKFALKLEYIQKMVKKNVA